MNSTASLPDHPRLYEINTRVWLREQGWKSLADIPDAELDEWAARFDIIWLMGVWQPSVKGRQVAAGDRGLAKELKTALPDLTPRDIVSSPYAVMDYTVSPLLGGNAALAKLRERMRRRGLKLMLDLVPNHTALDHPWVSNFPNRFVRGTEEDLARSPRNFFKLKTKKGDAILAHGRDPYFDGWTDTVQINIFSADMRAAMIKLILQLSDLCDGLRCDMAMLLVNRIFKKTWEGSVGPEFPNEFWMEAISAVKLRRPEFIFLAEVYWDMEGELQQLGFDYTYDKRLYDRLCDGEAEPIRLHLKAETGFQAKSARMVENHDELRAAAVFSDPRLRAAALLTYSVPGLGFFHEGQFEGRRVKVPVQLQRRVFETPDLDVSEFYEKLIKALSEDVLRRGSWRMLESLQAWDKNFSHERMFCFWWEYKKEARLAVINYAPDPSQTRVRPPISPGRPVVRFRDLLSDRSYDRKTEEVSAEGLYLDMPAFDVHLFSVLDASDGHG